jgi:YVTN family beta-propeller protein
MTINNHYIFSIIFVVSLTILLSAPAHEAIAEKANTINIYSNTISVIDSNNNKQIQSILVGNTPTGIAYNPKNNLVYVTNSASNKVSVINCTANKQLASISLEHANLPIANNIQLGQRLVNQLRSL